MKKGFMTIMAVPSIGNRRNYSPGRVDKAVTFYHPGHQANWENGFGFKRSHSFWVDPEGKIFSLYKRS
jgi:hypothetical protein